MNCGKVGDSNLGPKASGRSRHYTSIRAKSLNKTNQINTTSQRNISIIIMFVCLFCFVWGGGRRK